MFRRLVSNLSFSPTLVGQLGFYAKRLRKEETTRRLGLIFTVLALVMQSFAVLQPPEPANAASGNNIVYGGFRSKDELLAIYDRNNDGAGHNDIQQIYTKFGISRQDIVNASQSSFNSKDHGRNITSAGRSTYAWQTTAHAIPGTGTTVYTGNTADFDSTAWTKRNGSTYQAIIGTRSLDGQWFAIMMACGNPAYVVPPAAPPPPVVKTPTAVCTSLAITPLNRTSFRLTGKSSTKDGASISAYQFVVKNASGVAVFSERVAATGDSASATADLKTNGNYTAVLTVETSVGNRTDGACQKALTVSPEPRCPLNPDLVESSPDCKPCADDTSIWYKDKDCVAAFELTKKVKNLTQNIANANNTLAKPSDRVEYTLEVKNTGKNTGTYTFTDNLADVLEYSTVIQSGGGVISSAADGSPIEKQGTITWSPMAIKAGQSVQKTVIVQLKSVVPTAPQSLSNPESYNCRMHNSFGNGTTILVDCPPEKTVEQVVTQLPTTGPTENAIFAGVLLSVVTYFYARSRQMKKEVRLIRHNVNAGTI